MRIAKSRVMSLVNARLVQGGAGAFDANAVLHDRVGGIDRHHVVGGLALGGST